MSTFDRRPTRGAQAGGATARRNAGRSSPPSAFTFHVHNRRIGHFLPVGFLAARGALLLRLVGDYHDDGDASVPLELS